MSRTLTIRAIVAVSATAFAGAAHADLCSNLQQQYNAAGNGGASTVASARDVSALSRSLQVAQSSAEANHCTGFSFFGPQPAPFCPQIMAEVSRLQSAIRDSYRGGQIVAYAQGPSRDQIRSQMVANGCPVPGSRPSDQDSALQYSAGGYRTLCVRTCDGYYFPLAYGASPERFKTDAQACQAMYGGDGQAQLFVMPSDGDVADATPASGGGKSYGKQPYAFSYRSAFNPSCASQLQSGVATLASTATTTSAKAMPATATSVTNGGAAGITLSGPIIPIPQTRPLRFEDPETVADAGGGLKPTQVQSLVAVNSSSNGIRVVGASYFNQILDQQESATAPAPVPLGDAIPTPTP